jgi:predicted nucleotidyltransferase component of viral defense system
LVYNLEQSTISAHFEKQLLMDLNLIEQLKRIAMIALVSDDTLMEALVLKGGNAMSVHKVGYRASFDLDYSLEEEFDEDVEDIKERMERSIKSTFKAYKYEVFDFDFVERPKALRSELKDFWGGYKVTFKIATHDLYEKFKDNADYLRKNAISLNSSSSKTFKIDISKHEYTTLKVPVDVEGYTVYVYPPQMIVFEKLRAICQQNDEYTEIIHTKTQRGRARDFYDIHTLLENFHIDVSSDEAKEFISNVFSIKRVPISYIKLIRQNSEKHRQDFASLRGTVDQTEELKEFDFYLEYVMSQFENLFD